MINIIAIIIIIIIIIIITENNKCGRSKEEVHKEYQQKYEGTPLHGQFRTATEEVRSKRSWD